MYNDLNIYVNICKGNFLTIDTKCININFKVLKNNNSKKHIAFSTEKPVRMWRFTSARLVHGKETCGGENMQRNK